MKTRYALAVLAIALPIAAFADHAKAQEPSEFYVNDWNGISYCSEATETADKAFCAGTLRDARRDPDESGFDCGLQKTDAEAAYCADFYGAH